jgi:hypothetical protein
MLGLGLLGTVLVIVLVVWLARPKVMELFPVSIA